MYSTADFRIVFNDISWETLDDGVRQKKFVNGKQQLRLIEFMANMQEQEWCSKGHIGYVLMGAMRIEFEQFSQEYQKGDGIWVTQGTKHRISIEEGLKVKIILFEELDNEDSI